MKLKQINKGYKCPNCKSFGLKPFHKDSTSYQDATYEGHSESMIAFNFYRCLNCLAEFVEEK